MTIALYARVQYIDEQGKIHEPGDTVTFPDGSIEHYGLIRTGVLAETPPRREAGSNSARTEPVQ